MRNINPFGILIVVVGVVASFGISIYQGLQFSDAAWKAGIWAAMGAAAVTWEMIGWHRCAHLWRERRRLAFLMNVAGLVLASTVTILLFELAFLAGTLEGIAAKNEITIEARAALMAERASLQSSITKGGAVRGLAAIDSDITGIKLHPRWASTHGCTPEWITAKLSRELCERYAEAVAERGQAVATQGAQARIREITVQIKPLGDVGAADARALYISKLFGTSQQTARMIVGLGVIAFLFFCRAVAPFTMWDGRGERSEGHRTPRNPRTSFRGVEMRQPTEYATSDDVAALERVSDGDEPLALSDDEINAMLEAEVQEEMRAEIARKSRENEAPQKVVAVPSKREPEPARISGIPGGADYAKDAEGQVRRFMRECLSPESDAFEASATLWSAFLVWTQDNELSGVDRTTFGALLNVFVAEAPYKGQKTRKRFNGGPSTHVFTGVRLRNRAVHRLERQRSIDVPVSTKETVAIGS